MPLLQWLNDDEARNQANQVPYRLLEEETKLSYGDADSHNMLIQGDNLDALKALLPYYAGKVKCIFIDPPYNTKSAFEHYDDNLEHSQWLTMMYPRLELLRELLAEDGSIWITLDDNESHYCKVIMDEIFGRDNFVSNNIWQKLFTIKNSAKYLSDMHEHVICYAKSKSNWERNLLPRSTKAVKGYSNPDNDQRGPWTTNAIQARNFYSQGSYEIKGPTGKIFKPPTGTFWRISEDNFHKLNKENRIWWGKNQDSIPRVKKFLSEAKDGVVPSTLWLHKEVGTNAESKSEIRELFKEEELIFSTTKPEKLLQRILSIASNENELILDSFLGSGTTAAVAHKMGRKYIGIELGEHANTHCLPRLQKVVDGEQGGISTDVEWQGGGGFHFYRLGEAVFDEEGHINPDIKFAPLAAHVWFSETGMPYQGKADSPFLGIQDDVAYALLYNGILGDKRPNGGNVLTRKVLEELQQLNPDFSGSWVIYGESSRITPSKLDEQKIIFKQTPYDIRAR